MPFNIAYQILPHPIWKQELVFKLKPEEFETIAKFLPTALEQREVQMELDSAQCRNEDRRNETWNLYWKVKEGQSRVLLAHPEPSVWVGTVFLEKSQMKAVQEKLLQKEPFSLEQTGPLYHLGNLHLRFEAL